MCTRLRNTWGGQNREDICGEFQGSLGSLAIALGILAGAVTLLNIMACQSYIKYPFPEDPGNEEAVKSGNFMEMTKPPVTVSPKEEEEQSLDDGANYVPVGGTNEDLVEPDPSPPVSPRAPTGTDVTGSGDSSSFEVESKEEESEEYSEEESEEYSEDESEEEESEEESEESSMGMF